MYTRRTFLKASTLAGAGFFLLPKSQMAGDFKIAKARIGFIGVGLRGQDHLELALRRDDVDVIAICDIQQTMIDASIELIKKSGKAIPKIFKDDPFAYRKLLELKNID